MTSNRSASTPAGVVEPPASAPGADATDQHGAARSGTQRKVQPGTQVLLVVVLVLVGSAVALWALPSRTSLYIIAPVQVLLGSAIFIALILLVVLVFAKLGLYDRGSALALPDGSVRALIALILLIIFIIFANVIFGQLSSFTSTRVATFSGLSQLQVDRLPGAVQTKVLVPATDTAPTSFEGTYVVKEPNQEASAVGQQVVTGLLTLVAAISAFYFGSGSVAAGAAALRDSRASGANGANGANGLQVLRPSQPVELTPQDGGGFAPLDVQLGGSALAAAGVTAAVLTNDPAGRVRRGLGDDQFIYTPGGKAVDPVTLRFTSSGDARASVDLVVGVPAAPAKTEPPAAKTDPPAAGGPPPAGDVVAPPAAVVAPPAAVVAPPAVVVAPPPTKADPQAGGEVGQPVPEAVNLAAGDAAAPPAGEAHLPPPEQPANDVDVVDPAAAGDDDGSHPV